jgi:hypothetical protein
MQRYLNLYHKVVIDTMTYELANLQVNSRIFNGSLKRPFTGFDYGRINLEQIRRAASDNYKTKRKRNYLSVEIKDNETELRIYPSGRVCIITSGKDPKKTIEKFQRSVGRKFPVNVGPVKLVSVAISGKLNRKPERGLVGTHFPDAKRERGNGYSLLVDSNESFALYPSSNFRGVGFRSESEARKYVNHIIEKLNTPVEEEKKLETYRAQTAFPLIKTYYDYLRSIESNIAPIAKEQRLKGRKVLETFLEKKENEDLGNEINSIAIANLYLLLKNERGKITLNEAEEISGVSPTTVEKAKSNLLKTVGDLYKT